MSAELPSCVLHGVRVQGSALPRELLRRSATPETESFDRVLSFDWVETQPVAPEPLLGACAQGPGYSIGEIADQAERTLCFRYFECCEFRLQLSNNQLRLQLHPGTQIGIPWMIFENSVLGAWLALEGQPMLHAAAIVNQGQAWLIAGPSGAGKTTLALRCCAQSAQPLDGHALPNNALNDTVTSLLSDDAVRLSLAEAGCVAFPGTRELRLRENAEALGFGATWSARRLPDERLGVSPVCARGVTPVAGIFVPTLSSDGDVSLTQLFARDAMLALLSAQRSDWTPRYAARALSQARTLLERLPVFRVAFPQGTLQTAEPLNRVYALIARQMRAPLSAPTAARTTHTATQGSA